MSKLIIKNDKGYEIEVKEISKIGKGKILILHMSHVAKKEDIEIIENDLSKKFGRKIIILDSRFSETIQSI
jgi:hypothetical protein